jgi:hypothetical protein
MKKKGASKLRLNRETIRHLESLEVIRIHGGREETSAIACDQYSDCECPNTLPPSACLRSCSCSG